MLLLFMSVFEKLFRHRLSMDPAGHVVMPLVAEHADEFRRQCLIQYSNYGLTIRPVTLCDRAILDMLASSAPNCLKVGDELSLRVVLVLPLMISFPRDLGLSTRSPAIPHANSVRSGPLIPRSEG